MVDYNRTLSASVDAADGSVDRLLTANYYLSDQAFYTDSMSAVMPFLYTRLVRGSISVNDYVLEASQVVRALADYAGVADSSYREIAINVTVRTLTDALDMYDGDVDRLLNANYAVGEGLSFNDLIVQTVQMAGMLVRILSDYVDITDALLETLSGLLLRTLADNVSMYDLTTDQRALNVVLGSLFDLSDSDWQSLALSRAPSDSVAMSDSLSYILNELAAVISRNLLSSINLSDSTQYEILLTRLLVDGLDTYDAQGRLTDHFRLTGNAVSILDLKDRTVLGTRLLQSNAYVVDTISRDIGLLATILERTLGDVLSFGDSLSRDMYLVLARTLLASVLVRDTILQELGLTRVLQDPTDLQDILSVSTPFVQRLLGENIALSDEIIETIIRNAHVQSALMRISKRLIDMELRKV